MSSRIVASPVRNVGEMPNPPSREPNNGMEDILARHLDALYSAARRVSRSAADAEDLVQETCLRAHRKLGQLHSGTDRKVRGWLLSILLNHFRDQWRRSKRGPLFVDVPLEDALRQSISTTMEWNVEDHLEVHEALQSIEEEFRVVVWLSDAEGFTSREISRMLRLPQGTVASRLFRGRARLRRLLARGERAMREET